MNIKEIFKNRLVSHESPPYGPQADLAVRYVSSWQVDDRLGRLKRCWGGGLWCDGWGC